MPHGWNGSFASARQPKENRLLMNGQNVSAPKESRRNAKESKRSVLQESSPRGRLCQSNPLLSPLFYLNRAD